MGVVSLPSERSTRFENPAWPGLKTANFAPFGSRSRVLPKNAESLRDSDAHDARRCPAGVAAPLGCMICLQLGDVAVFSLCAQYFLNVRGGGGITTPGVLCVLPKRRTSACQSGSFVVFCGRTAIIDSSGVKFDPTHNLENFKIILIFLITCGMVVLLEIKPLHRSYYVGKL